MSLKGVAVGQAIRPVAWILVAALIITGCQFGLSGTDEDAVARNDAAIADDATDEVALSDGMRWFSPEDCAGLQLQEDQAVPLDPVPIGGWPDPGTSDHGAVVARVMDDADALITTTDASALADEPLVTVVDWQHPAAVPTPVHPSGELDGGLVRLQFGQIDENEARWCEQAHELQIEPLPAADADQGLTAQLELLEEIVETVLEPFGTDGQTLAASDLDEVPSDLVPAYVLAELLHNDSGLIAETAAFSDDELESADRLMARLQEHAADELPTSVELSPQSSPSETSEEPSESSENSEESPETDAQAAAAEPIQLGPTGDSAPAFAPVAMRQKQDGNLPGDAPAANAPVIVSVVSDNGEACTPTDFAGLTAGIGRQISGDTMASGNTAAAIDAAMFIGGLPVIGRIGLPTVLTAWATKFGAQLLQGMMPSIWERTDFEYDPDELWEDDADGGYIDAIGMQFTSEGWDMGPVIAELVIIIAEQVAAKQIKRFVHTPRANTNSATFWGEVIIDAIDESAAELVGEMAAWIAAQLLSTLLDTTGLVEGKLEFAPRCWDARQERPDLPEFLETDYFEAIEGGDAVEHFVARKLGTGRVDARWQLPIGAAILGIGLSSELREAKATFGANGEVEVRGLEVVWEPIRTRVQPGASVTLQVFTNRAHDGRVRITDSLGLLDTEVDAAGAGAAIFYQVPGDWDGTPIELTATSLSNTGLRDSSHPGYRGQIDATAMLIKDDLYVEPFVRCVQEGSSTRFVATDEPLGGNTIEVDWTATDGTISSDGVFTAPSQPGTVTVTATAVHLPDLQVSFDLTVGPCEECAWSATITGDLWDTSNVTVSGNEINAWDVDWETGAFGGLELISREGGEFNNIVLANDPDQPSASAQRSMHVVDLSWDVRSMWSGRFLPNEQPERLRNLLQESESEIPGWSLQSTTASLGDYFVTEPGSQTNLLEIPEHPTMVLRSQVSGPVMVGREVTNTIDGMDRATTAGLIGEAIYGMIDVQIDATLRPFFMDHPNRDLEAALDGGPIAIRDFDLERPSARCPGLAEADFGLDLGPGPGQDDPFDDPFDDDAFDDWFDNWDGNPGWDGQPDPFIPELPPHIS